MKVSLIIPTLNEVGSISHVLAETPKDCIDEIIIVDGNSTDGTAQLVEKLGYRVVQQKNKGFGDAFTTGVEASSGDVVVLMDGDGSHNPADIRKLLDKYKEGYPYVMASRYLPGAYSDDDTAIRSFGNWFFTNLVNVVHRLRISDSLFMFAAIDRKLYDQLRISSKGFEYCIEIIVKAHKSGAKIAEIPSIERKRLFGTPKTNALIHGTVILAQIFKQLLPNNALTPEDINRAA